MPTTSSIQRTHFHIPSIHPLLRYAYQVHPLCFPLALTLSTTWPLRYDGKTLPSFTDLFLFALRQQQAVLIHALPLIEYYNIRWVHTLLYTVPNYQRAKVTYCPSILYEGKRIETNALITPFADANMPYLADWITKLKSQSASGSKHGPLNINGMSSIISHFTIITI